MTSVGRFLRADFQSHVAVEKGKTAIAALSLDKLPTVIDMLITAVRNGEIDEQLALTGKNLSKRKAA